MLREYWRAWRQKSAAIPDRLKEALGWVGIGHGRTAMYEKLLREYSQGLQSDQHFFAYYEATEILDIFNSWKSRATDFPGIQGKISRVFKKGTVLSEDESASANSNQPRNDAFVYVLAGKLLHVAEAHVVSVDGINNAKIMHGQTQQGSPSDIFLLFRDNPIRIECKRPMNEATLQENADTAYHQLNDNLAGQPWGVIAIDASRIVRKPGEYLQVPSLEAGTKFLSNELEKLLVPIAKKLNHEKVLGVIGFSRIPLIGTVKSRILKLDGTPFVLENLSSAAIAYLCIKNAKSPQGDLMHELQRSFSRTTHDVPQDSIPIT
ncbi:MAG: hypothetical protein EPO61_06470 [Nitrospirae bacterium]|nr:MAG: hypothetical protein EPO61_06470 [Nitrospirota bacterium]